MYIFNINHIQKALIGIKHFKYYALNVVLNVYINNSIPFCEMVRPAKIWSVAFHLIWHWQTFLVYTMYHAHSLLCWVSFVVDVIVAGVYFKVLYHCVANDGTDWSHWNVLINENKIDLNKSNCNSMSCSWVFYDLVWRKRMLSPLTITP